MIWGISHCDPYLILLWLHTYSTKEVFEEVRRMCEIKGVEFSFAHDGEYQVLAGGKLVRDTEGA
jgi:hypothetical protein